MPYAWDLIKRLSVLKAVYWRHRPFLIIHRMTLRCNCQCQSCDYWQAKGYEPERELTFPVLEKILREAAALGLVDYAAFGGEPLLRPDLPEILAAVKRLGMFTINCTNGILLPDRARELAPHMDHCLVSIDALGEKHDRLRGRPGTFDRALQGIEAVKRTGHPVRIEIWTQIHRENLAVLPEVVKLARELDTIIRFTPIWMIKGYNEHLAASGEERREMINQLIAMKREGDPIINHYSSLELMKTGAAFKCNSAKTVLTIDWDGKVLACPTKVEEPLEWAGRLGESDLQDVLDDPRFRESARRFETCNECQNACAMDYKNNLVLTKLEHLRELIHLEKARPAARK